MMKYAIALLLPALFSFLSLPAQRVNLSFETVSDTRNDLYPMGWDMTFSEEGAAGYISSLTSENPVDGQYALMIQRDPEASQITFGAVSYWVPLTFSGDSITLKGYVRTENLADGYAGLWIRLDGTYGNYGYADMKADSLSGTNGWMEYSLTIPLNDEANDLRVGGLNTGTGKLWIDHLQVLVDGKPYQEAPRKDPARMKFPAMDDTEFSEVSGLTQEELLQVGDLALAGRVWGFAKYHHPQVAEGEHNMDAELFRLLHRLIEVPEMQQEEVMLDWLRGLGEVKECDPCEIIFPENAALFPDHTWITRDIQNPALIRQLQSIFHDRKYKGHYYFQVSPKIGNINFKHELTYDTMDYPDAGFRLLALFRYWNMINYFFPYRDLTDKEWQTILGEYALRLLAAEDALGYRLEMLRLIGEVKDTHANIWGNDTYLQNYFGKRRPAVQVRFINTYPVVAGYYQDSLGRASGLKPGDVVTHIRGKNVQELLGEMYSLYPASNQPTRLRNIARSILRTNEPEILLGINRDEENLEVTVPTYDPSQENGFDLMRDWGVTQDSAFYFIEDDIAYLNNGKLKSAQLDEIFKQIRDTRGIVIDDRNYPSDFLVFTLGAYLYPQPTEFVRFTRLEKGIPGYFVMDEPLKTGRKNNDYYRGKVAILVNEQTQSSAEYHAMAYRQAEKARVFGSTTAGADGNVSAIQLPGGLFSYISGIGVFYPDGTGTQRVGIVPDEEVHPTVEGVRKGEDEVLNAAVRWILED